MRSCNKTYQTCLPSPVHILSTYTKFPPCLQVRSRSPPPLLSPANKTRIGIFSNVHCWPLQNRNRRFPEPHLLWQRSLQRIIPRSTPGTRDHQVRGKVGRDKRALRHFQEETEDRGGMWSHGFSPETKRCKVFPSEFQILASNQQLQRGEEASSSDWKWPEDLDKLIAAYLSQFLWS